MDTPAALDDTRPGQDNKRRDPLVPPPALGLLAVVLVLALLPSPGPRRRHRPPPASWPACTPRSARPVARWRTSRLRKLWAEWDRGDPAQVEEELHAVASDAAEPAPVRVYAALLEAYARRRRGDLDGARARIDRLGYVGKWMLVGPFDNEGKGGHRHRRSTRRRSSRSRSTSSRDYDGKDHKPVRWRLLPAVSPYGWTDFGVFVRPAE